MWLDLLNFAGKRAVVTGAASGMGAATANTLIELGAEVHALDLNKPDAAVASFEEADLRDPAALDAAIATIGGPIHALVNCAGMPQTFPAMDVFLANFAGSRHLTEQVIPLMTEGGAIASVSSIAGNGWPQSLPLLTELVATHDFDAAKAWYAAHDDLGDPYLFSKMALNVYTFTRSAQVAAGGVRMNVTSPGNTSTGMSSHFAQVAGQAALDTVASVIGRPADAQEQANALVFLVSDAASYINGVNVPVDGGFTSAAVTNQITR